MPSHFSQPTSVNCEGGCCRCLQPTYQHHCIFVQWYKDFQKEIDCSCACDIDKLYFSVSNNCASTCTGSAHRNILYMWTFLSVSLQSIIITVVFTLWKHFQFRYFFFFPLSLIWVWSFVELSVCCHMVWVLSGDLSCLLMLWTACENTGVVLVSFGLAS